MCNWNKSDVTKLFCENVEKIERRKLKKIAILGTTKYYMIVLFFLLRVLTDFVPRSEIHRIRCSIRKQKEDLDTSLNM